MISVEKIYAKLEELIADTSIFIVDVKVNSTNDIVVEIDDSEKPINVKDCIVVSKGLEGELDKDAEDFSLQVASPGLSNPFKVKQQYFKNIGRELRVLKTDGIVLKGELKEVDNEKISLQYTVKERIEGRKAKHIVNKEHVVNYEEIKEAKIIISFK